MVEIAADAAEYPAWKKPVRAYFRRASDGWTLAGFERLPEQLGAARGESKPARR
jgi:hypothetical protein